MFKCENDSFLRAIWKQPVDKTPVWIMRQAGRYLPEYRKVREEAGSFLALCKTPELACEVTLQPLRRFDLDAAIVFSDILTIPDAMGLGLRFVEGEGPQFDRPVRSLEDVKVLEVPDPEVKLFYVLETIRLIQKNLQGKLPLIGFCGSPWTMAAYMMEGRGKSSFDLIMAAIAKKELWLEMLLEKLAESVALHLNAQIVAGVQAVMIFDTWGSALQVEDYERYSLFYIKQIIAQLKRDYQGQKIPVILYTRGKRVNLMAESGADVLGVDWQVNLGEARASLGAKVAFQGNMDPDFLLQSPELIQKKVAQILAEFGPGSGHVFNLGQGITPEVPPEHLKVLVDAVHELSRPYHR